MQFDILTIFPELFENFKDTALIARAQKKKLISIRSHDLRAWTYDHHRSIDDRPYGGGAGMVMMVEPIMNGVQKIKKQKKTRVLLLSAKGKTFTQKDATRYARRYEQLVLICGRYEGVDERVAKHIADEEVSIGDYVLFGGEVPAMVIMEAVTRLIPGAIGKESSLIDESFNTVRGIEKEQIQGLLEYPHYTRPEVIEINGKKRRVPKVLLSGNHKKIEEWRRAQSQKITKKHRPSLSDQ